MTTQRILLTSAVLGVVLTILPVLLIEATPNANSGRGIVDGILSLLVGPGMAVSAQFFGIHSLGFAITIPVVNWSFWTGITYLGIAGFLRLRHRER
jgi:hypothetical protein